MNILIVSSFFSPQRSIGAVRPTQFASLLAKKGHSVVVLTKHVNDDCDKSEQFKIIKIAHRGFLDENSNKASNNKKVSKKNHIFEYIKKNARAFINLYDNIKYFKAAKKCINVNFSENEFDIVLSSISPISSIFIGNYIKKRKIAKKLIFDFRDILSSIYTTGFAMVINRLIELLYIDKADLITVVSEGQKLVLERRNRSIKSKIKVIPNGYTHKLENTHTNSTNKLILTYTGSMYKGTRDFSVLFQVLKELHDENILEENIQICYAGRDSLYFQQQIIDNAPCLFPYFKDFGFITSVESKMLMVSSDILLLSTWNYKKDQGILTGKFAEYLATKRNILAIVSGNYPNAEISVLIDKLNIGFTFEMAQDTPENRASLKNIYLIF